MLQSGGGRGIAQRITDRHHSWSIDLGLGSLVPISCMQGLLGYPFVCPDMAGGGLSSDFENKSLQELDKELFVRSVQVASFMPMMQLSFAFWRAFGGETCDICIRYAKVHARLHEYVMSYVRSAAETGEPIVRNMAYVFNELPYCSDQFMLGDKYLIAPVLVKGATKRTVSFPQGTWRALCDGKKYTPGEYEVDAPLAVLPVFEREPEP